MDDKDKVKYKVGDEVCLRHDGPKDVFAKATITRVGRKYAYFVSPGNLYREDAINEINEWIDPLRHYTVGRVIPSIEDYLSIKAFLKKASETSQAIVGRSIYGDNYRKMTIEERAKVMEEMDHIVKVFTKEKRE